VPTASAAPRNPFLLPAGMAKVRSARAVAHERKKKAKASAADTTTVVSLRLYVAGRAPNSVKAIANLEAICSKYLQDGYELEIVDVCEHPRRALDAGVLVTPSLTKLVPSPGANVIGNLSDTASVVAALGLRATAAS
jgi:circadian clock protein KaiB